MGQDCYRVVDIKALGFIPFPGFEIFGINNLGQAVFTVEVDVNGSDKKHAFLYLPAAAYGLAAGSHDLHELAGAKLDQDGVSRVHDLNDAGVVIGQARVGAYSLAFVWDLADVLDNDEQYFDLGSLDTGTFGPDSEAWAINNDDPPFVVGDSLALGNCECPDTDNTECVYRGFRVELQGNDPLLVELSPVGLGGECDTFSYALDIAKTPDMPFGIPEIAGYTIHSACSCFGLDPSPCDSDKDAVRWTDPSPVLRLTDLGPQASESRGVNDSGSIVGWGFENAVPPDCQMSALFWETSSSNPVNLGLLLPPPEQSRAEAISNPDGGIMLVVGWNETTQHALRWQGSGTSWSVVDLNDKIINQCASGEIVVRQSHDVSDDGWIIALADAHAGPGFDPHAVILIPDQDCQVCCFADLDCSGIVGVSDFLELLGLWGPCLGCPADLDCDGVVRVSDLLWLLAAWGTCDFNPPGEVPRTVQDCYNKFYPNDLDALIACIEAVSG